MLNKQEPPDQKYQGSVLLADRIKEFVDRGWLIVEDPQTNDPNYKEIGHTFDEKQLRRAKYNVRLGKKFYKAGDYDNLSDDKPDLIIKPYELVFVESYEVFKLPKNVAAKYDLRLRGCLEGIGLQTGLQIDPTYYGRFFCPLFNFSNEAFALKYKDDLASVQFIYTTPSTPEAERFVPFDDNRRGLFSLSRALPPVPRSSGLKSLWADFEETRKKLENDVRSSSETLRSNVEKSREDLDKAKLEFVALAVRLNTRVDSMIGAVFSAMAFTIATLGIIVGVGSMVVTTDVTVPPISVPPISIGIGVGLVFVIAGVIYYRMMRAIKKIK